MDWPMRRKGREWLRGDERGPHSWYCVMTLVSPASLYQSPLATYTCHNAVREHMHTAVYARVYGALMGLQKVTRMNLMRSPPSSQLFCWCAIQGRH